MEKDGGLDIQNIRHGGLLKHGGFLENPPRKPLGKLPGKNFLRKIWGKIQ
jgi:hypothetical protein